MTIEESRFHIIADKTIDGLADAIDADLGDDLDVDVEGGILTIALPGGGQYIINKNAPMRQIWLSSPKSGASHFDWDESADGWRSTRGEKVSLTELLADELEQATGTRVAL